MSGEEAKFGGITCHPIPIKPDAWDTATALDIHTIKSVPIDQYHFDTTYSEIGKLVYELKNRGKKENAEIIAGAFAEYANSRLKGQIDCVIGIPPTHKRDFQPVYAISAATASKVGVPDLSETVKKTKVTKALKDVFDVSERRKELSGAFEVVGDVKGKSVLLVDDLFRSGETAAEVSRALKTAGAKCIHLLTATKTRVHR